MIDIVRDKPFDFAHGAQFKYNNTGYILLGMLIEKVSGRSYERFVQENIFDRVGMKDSGFDEQHKIIPQRARGYTLVHGALQNADFLDTTSAWSAGGFYSTVNDLIVWSEALAHQKLLNADSTPAHVLGLSRDRTARDALRLRGRSRRTFRSQPSIPRRRHHRISVASCNVTRTSAW